METASRDAIDDSRTSEDREVRFSVPSMDCASCAETVERSVSVVEGVTSVEPLPAAGTLVVRYREGETDEARIVESVEGAGYPVVRDAGEERPSPHDVWRSRRAIQVWLGAALLVAGIVLEYVLPAANPTLVTFESLAVYEIGPAWLAYLGAAATGGLAVLRGGLSSLRDRSLDIDLLMSAGIVGALVVGLPFEAATLAVLYSVAELLERFSMDRARTSLRELLDLAPDVATVLHDGEERTVPVEAVEVGETVAVRPGERVPVDGVVTGGRSAVDESPVTGESVPAEKAPGEEVYAGSIVEEGYLEVEVTAPAGESTLARVIELVEDAERSKTDHERFVDRFARYYTPLIVAGSILTVPVTMLAFGLSFQGAFVRGLTLLVIACPCAFVISTPVSVVSGVTAAARNGVLVKGGDKLEAAGEVDVVAFDKTGTLTTGELSVTDVLPLGGGSEGRRAASEADLLALAGAIERRSEHPISRAIVEAAEERGAVDAAGGGAVDAASEGREAVDGANEVGGALDDAGSQVTGFEALPGEGVRADVDGVTHYAGKPALFESLGFDLDAAGTLGTAPDGGTVTAEAAPIEETIADLQAEGKTVVLVGTEASIAGLVAVADTLRPEAEQAVARLHDLGLGSVMLTGDNERTARAIADAVGIDDVRADLLPDEKVEAVRSLGEGDATVAMVGDGVNDAPAMAAADVGVAMGAAGTDAAIETADVALLGDDLLKLPYLHRLSRRANRVIRQNVFASLAVKAVLAVGAPLGVVSVIAAIVVGDMGMSLGVTGNALRLARIEPER